MKRCFVSYMCKEGQGNCVINNNKKNILLNAKEWQREIANKQNVKGLIIMNVIEIK